MREKSHLFAGLTGFVLLALLSLPGTGAAQTGQSSAQVQTQAAIQNELQPKLDTLLGYQRSIVNVQVTLRDPSGARDAQRLQGLARIPGVKTAEVKGGGGGGALDPYSFTISSLHIKVEVDQSLPQEQIDQVAPAVRRWAMINEARGDTVEVIPQPWPEVLMPPSASQQNYLLYALLALLGLTILIAAIFLPLRKRARPEGPAVLPGGAPAAPGGEEAPAASEAEKRKKRRQELEEIRQVISSAGSDYSEILSEIRDVLERSGSANLDSVLAEIKEALTRGPQEADALLSEIRDTLSDLLDEQRKLVASGGTGGPAAAAGGAAAPSTSAAAGAAALAGGFGPEVVEVLGNIEDLIAQQLDKTPDTSLLEEPFKYLRALPAEDIYLLINDEEPKLAASILSQVNPKDAAEALGKLDEEKQFEVASSMSSLTEGEDLAEEIKAFLEKKLKQIRMHKDYIPVMGYRVLADILSSSRYAVSKLILENIEKKNSSLAAEVRKRMFLFEDILTLVDKDIEAVIHNLPREMVASALADASEEVRDKFLRNMTERAREMFEEDVQTIRKVQIEHEGRELPFNEAMLQLEQSVIEDIFRTVDRTVLKMALRGSSEAVQEKFFSGLTERAVAMLREDLEVMGSISRKRADEAQEEIMNILRQLSSKAMEAQHEVIATIRKLEREGQITVARFQEEMV